MLALKAIARANINTTYTATTVGAMFTVLIIGLCQLRYLAKLVARCHLANCCKYGGGYAFTSRDTRNGMSSRLTNPIAQHIEFWLTPLMHSRIFGSNQRTAPYVHLVICELDISCKEDRLLNDLQ